MKHFKVFCLAVFSVFAASTAFAAGACTQSALAYPGSNRVTVTFVCTGDVAGGTVGTIPNTAVDTDIMNKILGTHFLYSVTTDPTSGGTAPDAADVTVLMNGRDLLGGKGVGLLHATAEQSTMPYNAFSSMYEFFPINKTLTISVANQTTAEANWIIVLDFER